MSQDKKHPSRNATSETQKPAFVRNATSKASHQPYRLSQAFRYAGEGIVSVFVRERNMKIHSLAALFALALGFILHLTPQEFAIIVGCIVAVFAAECFNTALEAVVDLICPDYAELAKRAKDAAAGAVLICALGAVIVACLIYGPALLRLIS